MMLFLIPLSLFVYFSNQNLSYFTSFCEVLNLENLKFGQNNAKKLNLYSNYLLNFYYNLTKPVSKPFCENGYGSEKKI